MEKYLVKKPVASTSAPTSSTVDKRRSRPSQSRLKDLKGVVILEDIEKAQQTLRDPTSNDDLLVATLKNLSKKTPGRDILLKTGIGKTVKKMTKHDNLTVQAYANRVFESWKDHVLHKAKQQKQEVRYDLESQRLRDIAKKWFAEALSTTVHDEKVIQLESTVFDESKKILTAPYRRSCRQIAHKLRNDVNLQNKLVSGNISMENFVRKYKSSL